MTSPQLRDRARRARQLFHRATVRGDLWWAGSAGLLGGQEKEIVELVEATYRLHSARDGESAAVLSAYS